MSRVLIPPQDLDAERAVIGAMLVSEPAVSAVSDTLTATDFYSENHRVIFSAVMRLYAKGEPVDRITVSAEFDRVSVTERTGGQAYLVKLYESVPAPAHANRYAQRVRSLAMLRQYIEAAEHIKQQAYEVPEDVAAFGDEAEQMLYDISRDQRQQGVLQPLSEIAPATLADMQELYEAGGELTGVPSGFADVDAMTSGFQNGDLIYLAARPAMGKTAWALGAMYNASKEGLPGAIFSLEMNSKQLVQRLNSLESGVQLSRIRSGKLEADDWSKVTYATASLSQAPLYIDDSVGIGVPSMRARLRRLSSRLKGKVGMVMVDYLGLMSSSGKKGSREQEVAEISRSLKILAREFDVPVLALAQLSRACEQRQDKRPVLSDIRDSGGQEADADLVMCLYRDEYYNPDSLDKGIAEVLIRKARNGPTGKAKLAWIAGQARFASLSRAS